MSKWTQRGIVKNNRSLAGRHRYINRLLLKLSRQLYYPITTKVQKFSVVSDEEEILFT